MLNGTFDYISIDWRLKRVTASKKQCISISQITLFGPFYVQKTQYARCFLWGVYQKITWLTKSMTIRQNLTNKPNKIKLSMVFLLRHLTRKEIGSVLTLNHRFWTIHRAHISTMQQFSTNAKKFVVISTTTIKCTETYYHP